MKAEAFDAEKYARDLIAESKAIPPPPERYEYYPIHAADYHINKRQKRLEKERDEEKARKQNEIIARVAARSKDQNTT